MKQREHWTEWMKLLEKIFLCSSVLENYRAILRGVEENQSLLLGGLFFKCFNKGVSLIIPANEGNLHTFFSHLKLMPGSSMGNCMVYLAFPLPGHQMDAFRDHAFPIFILNSTAYIHTQISAAVLVSEARDLFMEKTDLIDCPEIQPGWGVCRCCPPATRPGLRRGVS